MVNDTAAPVQWTEETQTGHFPGWLGKSLGTVGVVGYLDLRKESPCVDGSKSPLPTLLFGSTVCERKKETPLKVYFTLTGPCWSWTLSSGWTHTWSSIPRDSVGVDLLPYQGLKNTGDPGARVSEES